MKKSIIIGTIIFIGIILAASLVVFRLINKHTAKQYVNMVNEIYSIYPGDVDDGVQYFMNCKEYENMNKEEQVDNMGDLLNLYEENNIIKNLYYDELGLMYTFTYNIGNIKGALGGVMLKDWDPMMN